MLAESPGALLAALDEALSAYLLMVRADGLVFRHEFIRQAVARMLAEPIQQALHRQFGQMLLARGGSAVPAAYHLIRGARPGDAQALAGLDRAVTELAPFAPQAAAELATGALALTLPSDPGRPARTAAAVRALTAAGQWDQTETLVRSALAVPLPASEGAALRCALASLLALTGRAAEAMTGQRLSAIGRYYGSPYLADGICLVAAQVLEARRGPRAALDFLAEALAGLPEHRSVLLADPASAPWLGRGVLAAGDLALAARIVSAINDTARDNPTLAVIRASAEHAEGLLAGDVPAGSMRPTSWRTLGPAPAR